MSAARELWGLGSAELRARLRAGHPVDPRALEGWAFRGTSLGLPAFVERLTWKTFQKAFWRSPRTGRLLGWNVRLEQDGVDAPSRPLVGPDGAPRCVWPFEVTAPRGVSLPAGCDRGLLVDYGRMPNGLDLRFVKDPIVAVEAGSADVLLGVSCVGPWFTPTWFTLEREHPVSHVPPEVACA